MVSLYKIPIIQTWEHLPVTSSSVHCRTECLPYDCIWRILLSNVLQWNLQRGTTTNATKKWSFKTGGLSSEIYLTISNRQTAVRKRPHVAGQTLVGVSYCRFDCMYLGYHVTCDPNCIPVTLNFVKCHLFKEKKSSCVTNVFDLYVHKSSTTVFTILSASKCARVHLSVTFIIKVYLTMLFILQLTHPVGSMCQLRDKL